jgi:hydrogenase-1 operon protein HyaF
MRAGFWDAPEGAEADMTIAPHNLESSLPARSGAPAVLATRDAEEWRRLCPAAAALLPRLAEALASQRAEAPGQLFDIFELPAADRDLLGDVLGEGEVSGVVALGAGVVAQIQESVMAGLWRVRFTDASGALAADYLEVAAIPQAVLQAAGAAAPEIHFGAPPPDAMNVMPVLAEIRTKMSEYQPGDASHIITFSLFPMNETDMRFLQASLGDGPVRLISRGYGACRVHATGARHVWSVQFYNAMDTIILDTLEIGGVPQAACAAEEDFRDSAERLREIDEAYFT